jgi:hypothetical protein
LRKWIYKVDARKRLAGCLYYSVEIQARPAIFNKHISTCESTPKEDNEEALESMKSELEKDIMKSLEVAAKFQSTFVPRSEPLAKASGQTSMRKLFASAPSEDLRRALISFLLKGV